MTTDPSATSSMPPAGSKYSTGLLMHTEVQHHPAALPTAAQQIREEHRAVQTGLSSAYAHAVEAGRRLNYAKSLVPHGGWLRWLKGNFEFASETANEYMRIARAVDNGELPNPGQAPLGSVRGALKQISAGAASGKGDHSAGDGAGYRRPPPAGKVAGNFYTTFYRTVHALGGEEETNPAAAGREFARNLTAAYEDPKDAEETLADLVEFTAAAARQLKKAAA